jgi:hypothetical protein
MNQPFYVKAPAAGDPSNPTKTTIDFDPSKPLVVCFRYGERNDTKVTEGFLASFNLQFTAMEWVLDPPPYNVRNAYVQLYHGEKMEYGGNFYYPKPTYHELDQGFSTTTYGNIVIVYDPSNAQKLFSVYINSTTPVVVMSYIDIGANKWPYHWAMSSIMALFQYGTDAYVAYSSQDACCLGLFATEVCPDKAACDNMMYSFCDKYISDNLPWCACINAAQNNPGITGVEISCLTACETPGTYTPSDVQPCTSTICGNIINTEGSNNVINNSTFDVKCQQQAANGGGGGGGGGNNMAMYIVIGILVIIIVATTAGLAIWFTE